MSDYDIDKVSPRPWRIGQVFRDNPMLRNWSEDGFNRADTREKLNIYSHMFHSDLGRSRIHVVSISPGCPNPDEHLAHIVHCVNAHDTLLSLATKLAEELEHTYVWCERARLNKQRYQRFNRPLLAEARKAGVLRDR